MHESISRAAVGPFLACPQSDTKVYQLTTTPLNLSLLLQPMAVRKRFERGEKLKIISLGRTNRNRDYFWLKSFLVFVLHIHQKKVPIRELVTK